MSPEGVHRPGGPWGLVTNRCVMRFDREAGRFRLVSCHPGETVEGIREATGFDFDVDAAVGETPLPSEERLENIRTNIAPQILEFYPEFAGRIWGLAA